MPGQITAGMGGLIGNAGEYYVVAELLKRGVIAALAPRNSPAFDVLATRDGQTVRIRVKTKSDEYDAWQWVAKKDGSLFRDLSERGDFTILVNLAVDRSKLRFFVLPTSILNTWLVSDFEEWVKEPGKRGRPHDPANPKRHFEYTPWSVELKRYEDNWELLWQ